MFNSNRENSYISTGRGEEIYDFVGDLNLAKIRWELQIWPNAGRKEHPWQLPLFYQLLDTNNIYFYL